MASARKYPNTIHATDVWDALMLLGELAHAKLEIRVTRSVVTPQLVVVRVEYNDPVTVADLGPVFTWQETLSISRRVELSNYLHRVLWDSWSAYHASPWKWTRGMRAEHVKDE